MRRMRGGVRSKRSFLCRGQGQRTTCQSRFSPPAWERLTSTDLMASHRQPFIHLLSQHIPADHGNKDGCWDKLGEVGGYLSPNPKGG